MCLGEKLSPLPWTTASQSAIVGDHDLAKFCRQARGFRYHPYSPFCAIRSTDRTADLVLSHGNFFDFGAIRMSGSLARDSLDIPCSYNHKYGKQSRARCFEC